MADVDIDPFGEHDKTDLHLDDTGENIPLPRELKKAKFSKKNELKNCTNY